METRRKRTGRARMMKGALAALVFLLIIMFLTSFVWEAVTAEASGLPAESGETTQPELTIESKDNKVPVYQAGKAKDWTLIVTNHGENDLAQVVIEPEMGDTSQEWPFQTDYQHYRKTIDIPAGQSVPVTFSFVQRNDVATTRYTIAFMATVDGTQVAVQKFYVNTTEKKQESAPAKETGASGGGKTESGSEAGGFSNGGAVYSSGGAYSGSGVSYSDSGSSYSGSGSGTDSPSVPRVIVTGFTTDPKEVRAGSDFTLTIHLKNTSTKTKVRNMLFDLTAPTEGTDEQTAAPAFLPASGSSSLYLNGIAAGQTADISIKLNAKADLLQKPYSIDLTMKYEDSQAQQIEAASSISIPVKQEARFEFSEFELSPESIAVGEEANVMTNLYNLGRTRLYNVKAVFEGEAIEKEELFIGNIDSGNSASIDAMLEGKKVTGGPARVVMKLTYEDESGNVSETTKELQLEVTEAESSDISTAVMEEETSGGFPVLPVAAAAVLAAAVAVVLLVRRRNRKKKTNEEEALLDELERSASDEQQQSEAP